VAYPCPSVDISVQLTEFIMPYATTGQPKTAEAVFPDFEALEIENLTALVLEIEVGTVTVRIRPSSTVELAAYFSFSKIQGSEDLFFAINNDQALVVGRDKENSLRVLRKWFYPTVKEEMRMPFQWNGVGAINNGFLRSHDQAIGTYELPRQTMIKSISITNDVDATADIELRDDQDNILHQFSLVNQKTNQSSPVDLTLDAGTKVRVFIKTPGSTNIWQQYTPDANTLCLMPFASDQGTTIEDLSTYSNDGTLVGNGLWNLDPTQFGDGAISLDFADPSYVNIPYISQYHTTQGTIELWFQINGVGRRPYHLFDMAGGSGTNITMGFDSVEGVCFARITDTTKQSTLKSRKMMSALQWTHLALTFEESGHLGLYQNGVEADYHAWGVPFSWAQDWPIRLGARWNDTGYLTGKIGQFHYSDVVRDFTSAAPPQNPSVLMEAVLK